MEDRVEVADEIQPEPGTNGDSKEKKNIVYRSDAQSAFHHEQAMNALKALLEVGPLDDDTTLPKLAIRAAIPSKFTEGHMLGTAIAACWANCIKYHHTDGIQEIVMMLASWAGVDAERAKLMVKAVIGEFQTGTGSSGGFLERAQNYAFPKRNKGV